MESDRLFCLYTQPYPGGNLPCCHFRFGPNQGFGCGYHPVFANPPHWHQRQEWFTHLDGTSAAVSNGILHKKLAKYAVYAEVTNSDDDICWEHEECEYWLRKGKIPVDELTELPPYHPDCECMVVYYR